MINNLVIFGDSYSTHKDLIPEGYAHFYCAEGIEQYPISKMPIENTWWHQLINKTDAKLIRNDAWSGSTISYTGYSGDCSNTNSFICRYRRLKKAGLFTENKIDTIIVFGGTNDSWAGAPIGEEMYAEWQESDLFSVCPAICYFMSTLKNDNPNTRVIFILNTELKDEISVCMKNAAERIGVELIELYDVDKFNGHPSSLGMSQICDRIIEYLK